MRTPHGADGPDRAALSANRPARRAGRARPALLALAAAWLCLALPIACSSVDRDGSTEEASGLTAQQLPDIPVPDGLLLQTGLNESHSFESGRLRHADLYYYGNLPVADVRDYMKERMPLHGWRLVEATDTGEGEGGRAELEFERRPNRAHCSIWVDSGSVTRMHVAVRTPASD